MKYPARNIDIDFPWTIEWLCGGELATLDAALVTFTVSRFYVVTPVSAIDVDITPIVKA
jgi:hypothetical protein